MPYTRANERSSGKNAYSSMIMNMCETLCWKTERKR
jgi:hypothetical protein